MGSVATLILTYFPIYGYVALFFLILISGTYAPIPGGLILVAVGAFAHEGYLNIFLAFFAALFGSITSDVIIFYVARRFGRHMAYKKYVENHAFAKRIETFAHEYPKTAIFVSRFIGLTSTPINAIMGLSQTRLRTFLSMDALGNAICTAVYLGVGYLIGMTAAQGAHFTIIVAIGLGAVALMYLVVFAIAYFLRD
jgi:membrane protein DedA with SNARE-associated domain